MKVPSQLPLCLGWPGLLSRFGAQLAAYQPASGCCPHCARRPSHHILTSPPPPAGYNVVLAMPGTDEQLINQTMALRETNPDLIIKPALGGASFNDPQAPTKHLFSEALSTNETRATLIFNILDFLEEWGFDGCDPGLLGGWRRAVAGHALHRCCKPGLR